MEIYYFEKLAGWYTILATIENEKSPTGKVYHLRKMVFTNNKKHKWKESFGKDVLISTDVRLEITPPYKFDSYLIVGNPLFMEIRK